MTPQQLNLQILIDRAGNLIGTPAGHRNVGCIELVLNRYQELLAENGRLRTALQEIADGEHAHDWEAVALFAKGVLLRAQP